MKQLTLFLLLTIPLLTNAQNPYKALKNYLKAEGQTTTLSKTDLAKYQVDDGVFTFLEPYTKSKKVKTQIAAIQLIGRIGQMHTLLDQKQKAINLLLDASEGNSSILVSKALTYLKKFEPSSFDKEARRKIESRIRNQGYQVGDFVMLAGYLQLEPVLQEMRYEFKKGSSSKQAVNLALTRCGNEEKITSLLEHINKISTDDGFVYEVAPLLVYTRQKEIMDYLLDQVLLNENNCTPADAETAGNINCAYRLLEMVAPVIEDFPLSVDATGDLAVADYRTALTDARNWIASNKNTYRLKTSIY